MLHFHLLNNIYGILYFVWLLLGLIMPIKTFDRRMREMGLWPQVQLCDGRFLFCCNMYLGELCCL